MKDWDLPPKEDGWRHNIMDPIEDRMKLLSEEIVYGLKYPDIDLGGDRDLVVSKLPMKKKPPGLKRTFGSQGWGLLVTMGFSYWKFLRWALICVVLTVIFAALWLHFVDATSIPAALAPAGLFFSFLSSAMTVAQKTEDTWHHKRPEKSGRNSPASTTPPTGETTSHDIPHGPDMESPDSQRRREGVTTTA